MFPLCSLFEFGAPRPPLEPKLGHSECPRVNRALVTKSGVTRAALAPLGLALRALLRSQPCQHCPQDRLAPVRVPDKDDNSSVWAPSFIVTDPVTDPAPRRRWHCQGQCSHVVPDDAALADDLPDVKPHQHLCGHQAIPQCILKGKSHWLRPHAPTTALLSLPLAHPCPSAVLKAKTQKWSRMFAVFGHLSICPITKVFYNIKYTDSCCSWLFKALSRIIS